MIGQDSLPVKTQPGTLDSETPPVVVTTAAAAEIGRVMADKGLADKGLADVGLRVFVTGGGCSGMKYGMGFQSEREAEADDIVFDSEGVRVYVDPVSAGYLMGAVVDYDDSLMGGGFRINNPNAAHSCGCGSSFRTTQSRAGLPDEPDRPGAEGGGCCSE